MHCLALYEPKPSPRRPSPQLIERRRIFRAARFGVHGRLPNAHGRPRPVSEILDDSLAPIDSRAHELGCAEEGTRLYLI